MTAVATIVSAGITTTIIDGANAFEQLVVLLPICYVLVVAANWVATRFVTSSKGARWWVLQDHRGRAAVFTKPADDHTRAYNLAAVPRRKELAQDLMRHVAAQTLQPLRGTAFPSVARIYENSWHCTDLGPAWWSMREIEFDFANDPDEGGTIDDH